MTDERAQHHYLDEPREARRSGDDHGSDRSQGRDRYERQNEGRSSSSRYEDDVEYTNGDNFGRERSSGSSHGEQGQGSRRDSDQSHYDSQGRYGRGENAQGPYTGHQEQYGNQRPYSSSRSEGRDQDRGSYRISSRPFSPEGDRGSLFPGSTAHGPYTGKGPKGYKRSDEQMCEEANQLLERNGHVDASEIEVRCDGGVLKLTGEVENRAAKREAEHCVESIYGVSDVMNELKVESGFFANLFGTGSNSDSDDHTTASKSSNKSSQTHI